MASEIAVGERVEHGHLRVVHASSPAAVKSDVKGRPWETRLALDIGFHSGYLTLQNDPVVTMPRFLGRSLSWVAVDDHRPCQLPLIAVPVGCP